jgi:hypothetical protein
VSERYTKEMYEEYRKEQDEQAAREQEECRERTEKESACKAWLDDGGRVEDFEREWPKLRDEGRSRRVAPAREESPTL